MGQVSAVLRRAQHGYSHWCPGCEEMHFIATDAPSGPNWSFDGNVEQPTFSPSVRITYNGSDADSIDNDGRRAPSACCHYILTSGQINFCGDSTHTLSGKTVPLPQLPPGVTDE